MRFWYCLILLLLLSACVREQKAPLAEVPVVTVAHETIVEEPEPYFEPVLNLDSLHREYGLMKRQTLQQRDQFARQFREADDRNQQRSVLQQTGKWLRQQLVNRVFPPWYGTEWDFNGYTSKPREGQIACGYFVSTPLKQIGFNLNRYKMAQADATTIARSLSDTLVRFQDFEKMLLHVAQQPDELYVIGLDNHVGFLYKSVDTLDFIHSTFVDPGCVFREPAATSPVLSWSQVYVLAPLTQRDWTMQKWLRRTEFGLAQ